MRAVNLLPSDNVKRSKGRSKLPIVLAATVPVLAAVAVFAFYSNEHASVTSKSSELDAVQHQIAAHPARVSHSGPAISATVTSLVSQRKAAVDDALGSQVAWDRVLGDVVRVLPTDVYVTALSAQSPIAADVPRVADAPPPPPSAQDFQLSGYTSSHDSVAHLLARLQLVPSLSDVTLNSSTDGQASGKPQVTFEVTATVVGSGFGAAS